MGFDTCARIFLVIINIFFLIIGVAFTAAGIILKWVPSLYEPTLNDFIGSLPSISSAAGVDNVSQPSTTGNFDLGSVFSYVGIGLLVFGIFIMIVALLGLIGACCKVKILLIIYIVIVLLLLIGKLTVLIMLVTGYFNDQVKNAMNTTLVNDYGGIDDFSITSLSWNFAMAYWKCCGVDSYTDFNYATKWNNNRTLSVAGYTAGILMQTPVTCCKTTGNFPSTDFVDANCTISPSDTNSNWKSGCYAALDSRYNGQKTTIIGIFAGVLAFELLCVVFAICILCRGDEKDQYV